MSEFFVKAAIVLGIWNPSKKELPIRPDTPRPREEQDCSDCKGSKYTWSLLTEDDEYPPRTRTIPRTYSFSMDRTQMCGKRTPFGDQQNREEE